MHAIGTAGCDRVARPASARSSRGRRLAEPRRETRRGIAARSAAVRLRGSRSARRSARREGGARSVPRERSVLRRAVAKLGFAEPPESAARRRPKESPDEQSTASIQRTLPQGNHHVEAEHEGLFAEETVEVVAHSATDLELVLHEVEGAEAPAVVDEGHWANFVIGGALIALGIVLAIDPFFTLANEGQCASGVVMGRCDRWYTIGPRGVGMLIGSGLAVAGGVVVMVAQPIERESGGSSGAMLRGPGGRF